MVLKRSAPARRCASAAVSSGSTATGAAWGWRERNVKVRSSTMTARITTTTSRAPRVFFIVRESGATGLVRQGPRGRRGAPSDDSSITLRCMISSFDYGDVRYFRMARTVLGRAIYWTGVYLIDGLLVDSGPPNLAHDVRRLVSNLAVRQCVTTHHHEDHSGNHGLLAAELRITPLAHAIGVSRLAVADTHSQLYRRVAWGARPPAPAAPLGEGLETPRFRFRVIHTPGHGTDHVALFEPERGWLLSGDLYLAPRRGQRLGLRLGERALERRPRGFAVSPTAESVRQLGHVHVAERAEADLHLAIGELAEQEGQPDPRDGSRILDDAVQIVGGGTVPLQRVGRHRHPRQPALRFDHQGGEDLGGEADATLGCARVHRLVDRLRVHAVLEQRARDPQHARGGIREPEPAR